MLGLEGKTAIVTGASRGIGKQIAIDLAGAGIRVVVAAKSMRSRSVLPGSIVETVAAIEKAGGAALAVPTDVRDDGAIEALLSRTVDHFGGIDILVHNAGALWWEPVLETPARRFDLVMGVNVRAGFLLAQGTARSLIDAGKPGHIVMMSPPLDGLPHADNVAYSISKHGMTMLATGLAEELRRHQIAVNSLWPATLIESQATVHWNLGDPSMWRKATIIADAVLAIVKKDPASFTGRQLIDEDLLLEEGVSDFSRYRCVPDQEPPRIAYTELAEKLKQWRPQ